MPRRRSPHPRTAPRPPSDPEAPRPYDRFRELDPYRVDREWKRYEGTPQRDLFRILRERFLDRHARRGGWVLEVGPGPGRFTPRIGTSATRRVLLDLSPRALAAIPERWSRRSEEPVPNLVVGDAARPPFPPGGFELVVLLGNILGFAGEGAGGLLDRGLELVAPGGTVLLEVVAAGGERSRYLARLPPGAVGRLLRAPPGALTPRVAREGFEPIAPDRPEGSTFRRLREEELARALDRGGFEVQEALAVAPALGWDPERVARVAADPKAFARLVELEEGLGRSPDRRSAAAALLLAARRHLTKAHG